MLKAAEGRVARVVSQSAATEILSMSGAPFPFLLETAGRPGRTFLGADPYAVLLASGDRVELLKTVKMPTLVIHGADDPLLPQEGGRDVAALVPGAQLEIYPGMGHDLPTALTPKLVERIAGFCKAA